MLWNAHIEGSDIPTEGCDAYCAVYDALSRVVMLILRECNGPTGKYDVPARGSNASTLGCDALTGKCDAPTEGSPFVPFRNMFSGHSGHSFSVKE